jgi:hypothetical protein
MPADGAHDEERRPVAWHIESYMADTARHLTATGDIDGEYVVDETLPRRAPGHRC